MDPYLNYIASVIILTGTIQNPLTCLQIAPKAMMTPNYMKLLTADFSRG